MRGGGSSQRNINIVLSRTRSRTRIHHFYQLLFKRLLHHTHHHLHRLNEVCRHSLFRPRPRRRTTPIFTAPSNGSQPASVCSPGAPLHFSHSHLLSHFSAFIFARHRQHHHPQQRHNSAPPETCALSVPRGTSASGVTACSGAPPPQKACARTTRACYPERSININRSLEVGPTSCAFKIH